ncbi:MAG TPA: RdgB/HAM1 family non-canonical purine NTP pyrophosphatase [Anaerolineae bacterium]|nr:RdgB/HAM1 family non-canonical purine NTP pyrophosphatase [Anaerolineae bacterium]HQK13696.1 RdgB/HAM1 family non-canonical purine NTP pyrophosphatase [Anaerolineae bacterium]
MMQLLLATHNQGKRREWRALLEGLDVELLLPDDLGMTDAIEETGDTYVENALIKARTLAAASGLPTLADDSGLEVDALDGAPGVRSARYHLGGDEVRYRALLKALDGVPAEQRSARFRCIAALVLPGANGEPVREFITEGVCEGVIGFEPRGEAGFGYDPVFYLPERGCTMAELSAEEKNRISHRARAAQAMRPILEREARL